jgi:hypothetical protein
LVDLADGKAHMHGTRMRGTRQKARLHGIQVLHEFKREPAGHLENRDLDPCARVPQQRADEGILNDTRFDRRLIEEACPESERNVDIGDRDPNVMD